MKTTLKELRNFAKTRIAKDVTHLDNKEMELLAKGRKNIAFSHGTYGCNGALFEKDGELYVVIGRAANLWHVM